MSLPFYECPFCRKRLVDCDGRCVPPATDPTTVGFKAEHAPDKDNNPTKVEPVPGPKQPPRIHGDGCICGDYERYECPVKHRKPPQRTGQTITAQHDETGRWWRGPRGALPRGYSEITAAGPWEVFFSPKTNERGVLTDTHRLTVSGPFQSQEEKRIYCERLAAQLNLAALQSSGANNESR